VPPAQAAAAAEAAIMGGFLADAAAMPLHWIYNTSEIAALVGSGVPEFFNPPSCPFYSYPLGWGTPYGQQDLIYLQVGAATGGFAPTDVEAAYYAVYRAGGIAPAQSWYQDASTKEFVLNEDLNITWPLCGGDDDQADAIAHMVQVAALYAGNSSAMLAAGADVIRVTQNTEQAVAFGLAAARVLEKLIAFNMSGVDAVNATIADMLNPARLQPTAYDAQLAAGLQDALANLAVSNFDYVMRIGQSCDWPFNLWTGSHLIAQLGASQADWVSGVRQTILAGGDSGSRGVYVGAAQAARMGTVAALPANWTAKATVWPTAAPLAAQLVAHRATTVAAAQ
jgi:ADP-ribosylglycohydrolase